MNFISKIKLLVIITAMVATLSACGGSGSSTSSGGGEAGGTFTQLFAATVAHPRCVNCHAFAEGGQSAVRHRRRSNDCSRCHSQDDFRESPANMTFTGQSASQICNTTINRRGGTEAMATLLKTSPHVAWAISDGSITVNGQQLALAPPQNQASWLALVDSWVAAGSSCQ